MRPVSETELPLHSRTDHIVPSLLTFGVLLAGCGTATVTPEPPPLVEFAIAGGVLTGPDTLLEGPATVRLSVADGRLDQVALVRLEAGHTVEEFLAATEVAYPPFWAHFSGGAGAVAPGGTGEVVLSLQPGQWLALAFDTGPDGFPRVRHQLHKPFTVVPGATRAVLPSAPYQLATFDYGFLISAPLVAGTHVVEVSNLAPQRHEVILVELPAGANAEAMAAWLLARRQGEAETPAPGRVVGGVAALTQSGRNYWTITVTPGNYAFLCLLADDGDGRPHLAHGHLQRFEVLEPAQLLETDSP